MNQVDLQSIGTSLELHRQLIQGRQIVYFYWSSDIGQFGITFWTQTLDSRLQACHIYQVSVLFPLDGLHDVSPEDVNGVSDAHLPGSGIQVPAPLVHRSNNRVPEPVQSVRVTGAAPVQRQQPLLWTFGDHRKLWQLDSHCEGYCICWL